MGSSFEATRRFEANKLSGVCGEEPRSDHLFSRLPTRCGAQQFLPELAEGSQRADHKVLTHDQGRPTSKCPALLSVFLSPTFAPAPHPACPGFGRRAYGLVPSSRIYCLGREKVEIMTPKSQGMLLAPQDCPVHFPNSKIAFHGFGCSSAWVGGTRNEITTHVE